MKAHFFKASMLASAVLLAACSSLPISTPALDQARGDFVAANNSAQVATYAPLEFKQAGDALEQANAAARARDSADKIDQLAYLAKQKIATARQVASQKAAEADIAHARTERDQLRLEARTAEADRAKRDAQASQAQAMNAEAQTREAQARSAQLEARMAELQARKTERGMIITIGDVLFGTDQARLTPDGISAVRKLADVLTQNPERSVLVEGFTDSTGAPAHNQQLSERRASSVVAALTGMGIARERVAMRGYGAEYPVAGNDTPANRQLNRRVEIVLSNEGAAIAPRR